MIRVYQLDPPVPRCYRDARVAGGPGCASWKVFPRGGAS
jgi:hypothetical protein